MLAPAGAIGAIAPPPLHALLADNLLPMIERLAKDEHFDPTRMERLLDMLERERERQLKLAFTEAMAKAQAEMEPVVKDKNNGQTKSKFASFGALDRAVRPIYTKHGFTVTFDTGYDAPENHVRVLCDVAHTGGYLRQYHVDMPADGKGAKGGDVMTKTHATGSAVTYGRRYLLAMIFNIATEDDDGNAAGGVECISKKQLTQLTKAAKDAAVDMAKFCNHFGIAEMAFLPASKFHQAIGMIALKKANNARKAEGADHAAANA
jgi:hypothetical protein